MAPERIVMITGANSGIAYGMTVTLLQRGYRVAALDLETGALLALTAEFPDRLYSLRCDVRSDEAVVAAASAITDRWGPVSILVNAACRAVFGPFSGRTIADLQAEMDVNLWGYVRTIQAVLPLMKEAGGGIIHNLSSGVGLTGFAELVGYTAAKGAIEALSRTLRLELAPHGVHVTLMHPPLTRTPSASPLGVPAQAMADPMVIGRKLARKIESTRPVIAPDFGTAAYLYACRRYPAQIGRLFSTLAERGRAGK